MLTQAMPAFILLKQTYRRHGLTYILRRMRYYLKLSRGSRRLSDCNLVVRQLFKDSY